MKTNLKELKVGDIVKVTSGVTMKTSNNEFSSGDYAGTIIREMLRLETR